MTDAAEMDAWCRDRAALLTERAIAHFMAGKSLEDPFYRMMLGEHRAYMAMRSFIRGSRKHDGAAA